MKKNYQLPNGFTLLELLVTIGIIVILVGFGTVSFSTAQKKSRDAKRRSDLKEIQNALEAYYSINSSQYPAGTFPNGIDNATYFSGGEAPMDPKLGSDYNAVTYSTSAYSICADMETDGTFDGSNQDYCISNLQ